MLLSKDELKFYRRQIILSEIGLVKQELLKQSSVLVVGAGGLGCPLLLMLGGLGIGKIGIIDFDTVSIHNLHRQYLYHYNQQEQAKVILASEEVKQRNPFIEVVTHQEMLTLENAENIISKYQIVVDGTDNFDTRYLVNDTCVKLNKPLVFGSIFRWSSQTALLNYQSSKNLRDLFPDPPSPEEAPSCAEAGVVNTVTTITSALMAQLTLFTLIGKGDEWKNKLILFDLLKLQQKIINF